MKNILFVLILLFAARIAAQNRQVNWSSFSSGFGESASVNLSLRSIAGQPLIGKGSNSTTSAGGGFFYNPNAAGIITKVEDNSNIIPSVYKLQQNYPNPFNPSTVIQYAIPSASNVKIEIFTVIGEKVATLIDAFKDVGYYEVNFSANGLPSGMYLYRISAGNFVQTKKDDPFKMSFCQVKDMKNLKSRRPIMKTIFFSIVLMFGVYNNFAGSDTIKIHYIVDLTKIEADSFYVTLNVEGIKADSIVFQFASTAPGVYEVMNVGRFVGNFEAFDYSGELLKIYRRNVNQYVIYNAKSLSKIQYQAEDSYDTNIKEFPIFSAAGSNLENDNVVINGQMVFGYFQGYQENPVTINFNYPKDWLVGTALPTEDGKYFAEDYDHLVDSPIMFGELTKSTLEISDTKVEVYCYSQNKVITASIIADTLEQIVKAVEKFLGTLPVKHYTFLFHFRKDVQGGALEHNYSSYYRLFEDEVSKLLKDIAPTAAHEFCHIVTPLHIHSDIIEHFNFEKPVASRHLWFYEGITNWNSGMALLRGGLLSEDDYLEKIVSRNLNASTKFYDSTVSLTESSLGCYDQYEFEWYHAYTRGELVGILLDLRILELSGYKFGLKDVINKMLEEYKTKSFPDEKLFDIIVDDSYPEIREILERYVNGTEALPMKEYLSKIGYDYIPEVRTGKYKGYISKWLYDVKDNIFFIKDPDMNDSVIVQLGIKEGDILKKLVYNGEGISTNEARYYSVRDSVKPGEIFSWIVERDGQEVTLTAKAGSREIIERHKIVSLSNPTKEQLEFRKIWRTNNEVHN